MGAIAGSAILKCRKSSVLDTVTLTINNRCNLKCPHCYLQYDQLPGSAFSEDIFKLIENSTFRHLAIVGKEPLIDAASVQTCAALMDLCSRKGTTVSLVTNALNARSVPISFFSGLSFIDISLDGGKLSYESYRGGSLSKLQGALDWIASANVQMNALQVINTRTLPSIGDMLAARSLAPFHKIVFSPYLQTSNDGFNSVDSIPLPHLLKTIASSQFSEDPGAVLLLHQEHLRQSGISQSVFMDMVDLYDLREKVVLIEQDPLMYGIIRVTYDGLVMRPSDALHTRIYRSDKSLKLSQTPVHTLQSAFSNLQYSAHGA